MSGEPVIARKTRRGLGLFMLIGGLMYAFAWRVTGPGGVLLGALLVAVGTGVLRDWRWARWMALGACSLMIIGAFALPLILLEYRPFIDFADENSKNLMFCAFGAAFGVLGYRGLAYFRSDLARDRYSKASASPQPREPESSAEAFYSATVWVGVLIVLGPIDIFTVDAPEPATRAAKPATPKPRLPASEARPALPEVSAELARHLPDLEATALCLTGQNTVQAVVRNNGASMPRTPVVVGNTTLKAQPYQLEYTDLGFHPARDHSWARVPEAGKSGLVTLSNTGDPLESEHRVLNVQMYVDSRNLVPESDETNNHKTFRIEYRYIAPVNLPRCLALENGGALTRLDAPP